MCSTTKKKILFSILGTFSSFLDLSTCSVSFFGKLSQGKLENKRVLGSFNSVSGLPGKRTTSLFLKSDALGKNKGYNKAYITRTYHYHNIYFFVPFIIPIQTSCSHSCTSVIEKLLLFHKAKKIKVPEVNQFLTWNIAYFYVRT